jgi:methylthioribose-1-phosphate isomerase
MGIQLKLCLSGESKLERADMVTQSAGPYTAAAMGMALATYECRDKSESEQRGYLLKAADTIAHARPTTVDRMSLIVKSCCDAAEAAWAAGENVSDTIVRHTIISNNNRYHKIGIMAKYLVDMFPKNGKILTQCFGETIVGQMLKEAKNRGNELRIFCAETRPYFQGTRLTASVSSPFKFESLFPEFVRQLGEISNWVVKSFSGGK